MSNSYFTPAPASWSIRAVQLDLARQIESLPAIREWIRFAARYGFNTLFLYLEGVIRTESFPFRDVAASYTPEQIREVVSYAAQEGLDVIPCISTLGHAEHFLTCDEMLPLKEADTDKPPMFCPSNPACYEFLENYLREICALFPTKHIHIGCDEAWALGSCPRCRERMRLGETREDLLVEHVLKLHKLLTGMGKRVWIWDDMFENDTEHFVSRLPRDVVLCAWHYFFDLMDKDGFQGHFNNLRRSNPLPLYERLGFEVVICPWARGYYHVERLTRLVRNERLLGGILTVWEMKERFLPGLLPVVAMTGALWSNLNADPELLADTTLKQLFPGMEHTVIHAIRGCVAEPLWRLETVKGLLKGAITLEEMRHLNALQTYVLLIDAELKRQPENELSLILRELSTWTEIQITIGLLRKYLPQWIDPRNTEEESLYLRRKLDEIVRKLDQLEYRRANDWQRLRPGITPDWASQAIGKVRNSLVALLDEADRPEVSLPYLMTLRLAVPDSYGAPELAVEIRDGDRWREVYRGCTRPINLRDGLYTHQIPLKTMPCPPLRVRLSVSGYGYQGITYLSIVSRTAKYVPAAIASAEGNVLHPLAVLTDHSSACFLGNPDIVATMANRRERDRSSLEIILKEV